MGVPSLEVSYTSATTGRGDHKVHKGHVVALKKKVPEVTVCQIRTDTVCEAYWKQQRINFYPYLFV
jgi:hypothetical protein